MTPLLKRSLFLMFFFSGFCGLLYQVVWLRMAFASFGVITPVLSIVVSIFMLGLYAGTRFGGAWVSKLSRRFQVSAMTLYGVSEAAIAVSAFAVPFLFVLGDRMLLPLGETHSAVYLLWSAVAISVAIFPWCFFMGMTFPLVMGFVREVETTERHSFSFLYLANVIGAMSGTLITALVLVEFFGFQFTLILAACMNGGVALGAFWLAKKYGGITPEPAEEPVSESAAPPWRMWVLFATGFASMAMEVVWTRAFAVVLRTQVYSFALLLFTYLLATWVGSWMYRRHLARDKEWTSGQLIMALGLTCMLPVILNDPQLGLRVVGALLSIFPFCVFLGYLTPKLIDEYSEGNPGRAGSAYGMNILGCILGPLVASYVLLPLGGPKVSLLVLGLPFVFLSLIVIPGLKRTFGWAGGATVVVLLGWALMAETFEDRWRNYTGGGIVKRDHTASVVAFGSTRMDKQMLVNGIGITSLHTITKVMAHMPVAFHPDPKDTLVICFGMGTTYRSLLSWDVNATAVELVPSVKEVFPFFFDDAKEVLAHPKGRVVIDDGRRFLRRTEESFDVITIDPPPPTEAAGSSLLYSTEFYELAKKRMKPGAILQQWVPETERATVEAVASSLMEAFPHVVMYQSYMEHGNHFMASMEPLPEYSPSELVNKMPESARKDMMEWETVGLDYFWKIILEQRRDIQEFITPGVQVTDDQPYNEYFFWRRVWDKYTREEKVADSGKAGKG